MLSQARNIPQAHSSLVQGRWERSKFGGIEVTGKTLGVVGFGRIGQMVAERAKGLGMNVIAYDPLVAEGRYRELGVNKAETPADLYARRATSSRSTSPRRPRRKDFVSTEAFAAMKKGARLINAARGDVVDTDALVAALESGHLGGAGIDVFPTEPTTESPLFGLPGVVVTPHLGASTEEAQDRAGVVVAEQVAAALTGGVVTSAVNLPALGPEALAVLGPFLPLARQLGQLVTVLAGGVAPLEISYEGDLATLDTRILTSAVLAGVLHGRIDEAVNVVNASSLAAERGIEWSEITIPRARDYTNRLSLRAGDVSLSGTTVGTTSRPRLVSAFGQDIDIELAPHIGLFRYLDIPGQIGRVGTILGLANVNIASMAVSRSRAEGGAVMAVTVDSPVPDETVREIANVDGFAQVWFAALDVE